MKKLMATILSVSLALSMIHPAVFAQTPPVENPGPEITQADELTVTVEPTAEPEPEITDEPAIEPEETPPAKDPTAIPELGLKTGESKVLPLASGGGQTYYIDGGYVNFDAVNGVITGCSGYPSYLNIPEKIDGYTVKSIGSWAFSGYSMSYLTIPATVISIGNNAFSASDVEKVRCLEDSAAHIYASINEIPVEFLGAVIDGVGFIFDKESQTITGYSGSPVNLVIPSQIQGVDVKHVGYMSFAKCSTLVSVEFPSTVETIEYAAFQHCSNIENVTMSEGLKWINGSYAFDGCAKLTSLCFPSTMESISSNAFLNCENISEITIKNGSMYFYGAFPESPNLTKVIVVEGVTKLDNIGFKTIPLNEIILPDTLTEIADHTFSGCTDITGITLPASLEKIGHYAFKGCSALTNIALPAGLTFMGQCVFDSCSSLTDTIFENYPAGLTSIGYGQFAKCTSLVNVVIPDSIQTIEYAAFQHCSNIENVTMPEGLKWINGSYAFDGCAKLTSLCFPLTMEYVSSNAFWNCGNISEITIKNGSMSFYGAFPESPDLTKVIVADGVTKLDNIGFKTIPLSEIILPDTLTEIADHTFSGCTDITGITLPASLEKIGHYAFKGCSALTDITLPAGLTFMGQFAFDSCSSLTDTIFENYPAGLTSIEYGQFTKCTSLVNVVIPDSIQTISYSAFQYCSNLETLTMPEGLKQISGSYAFDGCAKLTSLCFPSTMEYISSNAFLNCEGLTEVTLKNGNTQLYGAFYECPNLTRVIINDGVTSLGNLGFNAIPNLERLYIPKSVEAFNEWMSINTDKTSIYCYYLSNAHTYAETNEIPYVIIDEVIFEIEPLEDIHVPYGTGVDHLMDILPDTVNAKLDTGATVELPVIWSWTQEGDIYGCTGAVSVSAHISNSGNLVARVNIIVDPRPIAYYTVTFVINGDVIKSESVEEGAAATAPEDIYEIAGYTFTGWSADFNKVMGDMTIAAVYTANTYSITYVLAGGTNPVEAPLSYIYATGATLPNPIRDGYTFNGWYDNADLSGSAVTNVTSEDIGNKTFYAAWTKNTVYYTVTFMVDGTVVKTETVEEGKAAIGLEGNPQKDGYTFTGWDADFSSVTSDMTIHAIFTEIPLEIVGIEEFDLPTIPYYATEAEILILIPSKATVILSNGTKTVTEERSIVWTWQFDDMQTGYIFTGNIDSYEFTKTAVRESAPITTYTVTFISNGNVIKTENVVSGTSATAPTPEMIDGYVFTGWDVDFSNVTSDLTVTAVYTQIPDAKSVTVSNITAKAGQTVTVSIDVDENTNMALGALMIDYDHTLMSATGYEFGTVADGTYSVANLDYVDKDGNHKIRATFMSGSAISKGGNLFNITFAINSDVENGTQIPVILESALFYSEDEVLLPVNINNGVIDILNYTLGDVNGYGVIDILDAYRVMRYDLRLVTLSANELLAGDVNGDGVVNIFDALMLQQYDIGVISTLE